MRKSCFCQLSTYELGFLAVFVTRLWLSRLPPLFSGVRWRRNCCKDEDREMGGPLLFLVKTSPPEKELLKWKMSCRSLDLTTVAGRIPIIFN